MALTPQKLRQIHKTFDNTLKKRGELPTLEQLEEKFLPKVPGCQDKVLLASNGQKRDPIFLLLDDAVYDWWSSNEKHHQIYFHSGAANPSEGRYFVDHDYSGVVSRDPYLIHTILSNLPASLRKKDVECFINKLFMCHGNDGEARHVDELSSKKRKRSSESGGGEEVECCICLDKHPELMYSPCRHRVVCTSCHVIGGVTIKVCPICQAPVKHAYLPVDSKIPVNQIILRDYLGLRYPTSTNYDESRIVSKLRGLLTKCTVMSEQEIERTCQAIRQLYASRHDIKQGTPKPLLSVDKAEEILVDIQQMESSKGKCKLINLIVAMCELPWGIDKTLGSPEGICYFGNYGQTPEDISKAVEILLFNHSSLLQDGNNQFW